MVFSMDEPFQCKVPTKHVKTNKKTDVKHDEEETPLLSISKDIALAYFLMMYSNYMHEAGHGLTYAMLYRKGYFINVGRPTDKPWLQIGALAINSLNPFEGASMSPGGATNSPWKNILVSLAGPILGGLWSTWKGISLQKKHPDAHKYFLSKFVCLIWLMQNCIQLVPFEENGCMSDGMHIYRALSNIKQS